MSEWQTMDSAPKDGTRILGWSVEEPDTFLLPTSGLSHVDDGPHVIVWGSRFKSGHKAAWWFRFGSEFTEIATPTHWLPIPADPLVRERPA